MSWESIRADRIKRLGRFGWFLSNKGCPASCECFWCRVWWKHNREVYEEIAAEYGWMLHDDPAGDVPLG